MSDARIAIPWRILDDGKPDYLLQRLTNTPEFHQLLAWQYNTPGIPEFPADFHRLQLEHWLWTHRVDLVGRVMDVGVEWRRDWASSGYFTFGPYGCDVTGQLESLPFRDGELDAVICTEVMEHVADPFQAAREIHRVLRPDGVLLASSPFLWPDHHCDSYPDYWRFTPQGWARLLGDFREVSVQGCRWTDEGAALVDLVRRFEGQLWRDPERATTGYVVRAVK